MATVAASTMTALLRKPSYYSWVSSGPRCCHRRRASAFTASAIVAAAAAASRASDAAAAPSPIDDRRWRSRSRRSQRRRRSIAPAGTTLSSRSWYHGTPAVRGFSRSDDDDDRGDDDDDEVTTTTTRSAARTPWSELLAATNGTRGGGGDRPSWSAEWKRLGLGASLVEDTGGRGDDDDGVFFFPRHLFFVQLGFGVDQHGDRRAPGFATKAAIRAVRNAIEFNSIPGVIDRLPGGRHAMLIHVRLGVPLDDINDDDDDDDAHALPLAEAIDPLEVAKVFPYGKVLPIEVVRGGLDFHSGRIVEELGDQDDVGICCVACVSIGYNKDDDTKDDDTKDDGNGAGHTTYNTKDGY